MGKGGPKSQEAISEVLENLNKAYEDKTLFNAVYEISCEYYEEGITREMMRRFADRLSKLQYEENISDQELGEFIGASHSHVQKLRTIGVSKPTDDKKTSDRKESSDSKKASPDKKNSEAKYPKYINQAYFVGICLRFGCSPNYLFGDTEDPEQFLHKRPRFISGDRSDKRTILERCHNCDKHKEIEAYNGAVRRCQNCDNYTEIEAYKEFSECCQKCDNLKGIEAYKAALECCQKCDNYKEIEEYHTTLSLCQNCADYKKIDAYKATEKGREYIKRLRESLYSKVSACPDDTSPEDSKELLKCQNCPGFMNCSAFNFRRDFKIPIYPWRNLAGVSAKMVMSTLLSGTLPPEVPDAKRNAVRNMLIDTFVYLAQLSGSRRDFYINLFGESKYFCELQKQFREKAELTAREDTSSPLEDASSNVLWKFMRQSIARQRLLRDLEKEISVSLEYQDTDYCNLICGIVVFDLSVTYTMFQFLNNAGYIPINIEKHEVFSRNYIPANFFVECHKNEG